MDDFEKELKIGFLDEAAAAIADAEQSYLALESNPDDTTTIDKIFRLAHNLKGSSKAVGFDEMGAFTHEFESLLLKLKNKELVAIPSLVSLLLRCNDHLNKWVEELRGNLEAQMPSGDLIEEIQNAKAGKLNEEAAVQSFEEEISEFPEQDSISLEELELLAQEIQRDEEEILEQDALAPLLKIVEEPVSEVPEISVEPSEPSAPVPLAAAPPAAKTPTPQTSSAKSSGPEETIRVALPKLEKLLNYVGEMVILQSVLSEQVRETESMLIKKTAHQLGKVTKEIQDISMSLRMVPIKTTFQKMQRIVRDTAQALNKDVQLILIGEETELDKTVLERINDPLVHLIRNSVDHGIETTEQRLAAGKNPTGKVTLSAFHQSGRLVIEVQDDGGGINPEKIKKKAIEKGIIDKSAQLSEKEALNLIFSPSFSTKEQVTDISGRGVGMDVVKTNIEELQGEITILSTVGSGSIFRISLPLTLAIIEGMTVRSGDERYVVPLNHIFESLRPQTEDVKVTTNIGELLVLRGETLPLYRLSTLFGRKSTSKIEDMISIIIRSGSEPYGLLVDDIIGRFQVVIKKLGPELSHLKGVSGSTILGDGRPALIIEPNDLIKQKSDVKKNEMRRTA